MPLVLYNKSKQSHIVTHILKLSTKCTKIIIKMPAIKQYFDYAKKDATGRKKLTKRRAIFLQNEGSIFETK